MTVVPIRRKWMQNRMSGTQSGGWMWHRRPCGEGDLWAKTWKRRGRELGDSKCMAPGWGGLACWHYSKEVKVVTMDARMVRGWETQSVIVWSLCFYSDWNEKQVENVKQRHNMALRIYWKLHSVISHIIIPYSKLHVSLFLPIRLPCCRSGDLQN